MSRLPLALIALTTGCGPSGKPPSEAAHANAPADNRVGPPVAQASTAPDPTPIPARFRGSWAVDKAACADLDHPSRITISGRTVRHPTFVIVGYSVTTPTADQFALKGHFEGSHRPAEAQYFIDPAGEVITDGGGGGAVRVRCG